MNSDSASTLHACLVCGYVYDEAQGDPAAGVAPSTRWDDLPADWSCPDCGVGKSEFSRVPP